MDIEEYIKNKHRNKSSNDTKIKYLKNLVTRILLSIILFISVNIYIKYDDKNILLVEKYIFKDNLKFTKMNNLYEEYMGKIIPSVNSNSELVFSSNDIKTEEYVKYKDGFKINMPKNQIISSFNGGIVVFIGEKDHYENTVIIQGNDGIDYWYGGITNIAVNLYDYIEKDTLIGETKNDYLYLVFQKDGKYLNYEDVL